MSSFKEHFWLAGASIVLHGEVGAGLTVTPQISIVAVQDDTSWVSVETIDASQIDVTAKLSGGPALQRVLAPPSGMLSFYAGAFSLQVAPTYGFRIPTGTPPGSTVIITTTLNGSSQTVTATT